MGMPIFVLQPSSPLIPVLASLLRRLELGELSDDLVVRLNGHELGYALHVSCQTRLGLLGEPELSIRGMCEPHKANVCTSERNTGVTQNSRPHVLTTLKAYPQPKRRCRAMLVSLEESVLFFRGN